MFIQMLSLSRHFLILCKGEDTMTLEELKQFLEDNKDNEEVQKYLEGLYIVPKKVKTFLETDAGKKLIQPMLDSYFSKGLESWKEKTMPGLIEEEIKKKFPDETEEQKRLRKLEEELAKERQARTKSELINKATTLATQKGLPVEVVHYFVGQDEEETVNNLTALENIWQSNIEKVVSEKFKENGRIVDPSKKDDPKNNPWSKKHFNLTEQGRILRENPELAKKLKAQAN